MIRSVALLAINDGRFDMARFTTLLLFLLLPASLAMSQETVRLQGAIVDVESGESIAARLYIQSADGKWHHAKSADEAGSAVEYRKQRSPESIEVHTTLSAHPFVADLPAGRYTITAERGKEYLTGSTTVDLTGGAQTVEVRLRRWIDMAKQGWYSGETHVHRSLAELPNVMLAEDLNVALPLTYWVTQSDTPPSRGKLSAPNVKPQLIKLDTTHVIYPRNTEYEIFTVGGKRHTLGAIFALNQQTRLESGVPPVAPIAEQVHREGGLLELDKHNWPWSMMLIPVMDVDLYELTNNHIWRAPFYFSKFGEKPPAYMRVDQDNNGMTEKGWIDFTFQNYYALLNCGFRMRPTAGTASGVHPVPLGFGRVYVHLPDGFSYTAWMKGLDEGRTFVTTGPMLTVTANGTPPGTTFRSEKEKLSVVLRGTVTSPDPIGPVEIIVAGELQRMIAFQPAKLESGAYQGTFELKADFDSSAWLAVRCYTKTSDGRLRFAHTAPWHIDLARRPLRPKKAEVAYLVERVRAEIERNRGVVSDEALAEFEQALAAYEEIGESAR